MDTQQPLAGSQIILIVAFFFVLIVLVKFLFNAKTFISDKRYIDDRIRNTTGPERRHWKHERLRLLLSLLPFVKF